jgi:hypothetical protein
LPRGKELLVATSELFITYKLLGDSKRNLTELRWNYGEETKRTKRNSKEKSM